MTIREKVVAGAYMPALPYVHLERLNYNKEVKRLETEFIRDLSQHVEELRVPKQYSLKVAHKAWRWVMLMGLTRLFIMLQT